MRPGQKESAGLMPVCFGLLLPCCREQPKENQSLTQPWLGSPASSLPNHALVAVVPKNLLGRGGIERDAGFISPTLGIHKAYQQSTNPSPGWPTGAWEGTLHPRACLGLGSGHGGSLSAKQSLGKIDGERVCGGEARGQPAAVSLLLFMAWPGGRD